MRRYPPKKSAVRRQLAAMEKFFGGKHALDPERLPESTTARTGSDAQGTEREAKLAERRRP